MTLSNLWKTPTRGNRRAAPGRRAIFTTLMWVWAAAGAGGSALAAEIVGDVALLQGLDKVTARISTFRAPVNATVYFGTLEIVARTCRKRPPEEPPESAAFLEIRNITPGEAPETLFKGWMFASSPALSALEHPVYDIWVIDCLTMDSP